jgi:glucose/arabinose dehydrogenase
VGDRGERDINPQDITRDNGKIYRLNDDGSVPIDNPFVGVDGAKEAIYSYGHRNAQGLTIHPETGEIWAHEHGPRGGDEINIIEAGKNYGWPKITYGKNYTGTTITKNRSLPGMEQPFYYWVPSIAASGIAFVTGDRYPDWKGSILVGSLKKSYLERLTIRENKVVAREKVVADIGRVRDVIMGPYGYIYIAVEFEGIYLIKPKVNK